MYANKISHFNRCQADNKSYELLSHKLFSSLTSRYTKLKSKYDVPNFSLDIIEAGKSCLRCLSHHTYTNDIFTIYLLCTSHHSYTGGYQRFHEDTAKIYYLLKQNQYT
ncbi:hypothetical protein CHS0354_019053 [Potamilus streckersoni]|uniref:Uncharacterized protein n=1 Tax=Potamilus streckersoni TaxID=2493646 RepID=A0AAE0SJU8_9BIVA|nr:hypothetical protein CHS0354_019053 [Potamilus streckersoni]